MLTFLHKPQRMVTNKSISFKKQKIERKNQRGSLIYVSLTKFRRNSTWSFFYCKQLRELSCITDLSSYADYRVR